MDSANPLRYRSIQEPAGPEEIKIKGSRFIGFAYPVSQEERVNAILAGLRKKYHDATHICTAWRFHGRGEEIFHHDDDGEPAGTAGLPIYFEITRDHCFNVLVAVVRYFGGRKLGTGGLARAYGETARRVLESAKKVSSFVRIRARVFFPYDFTGEMRRLMESFSIHLIQEDHRPEGIHMEISLPLTHREKVCLVLRDMSKGSVKLEWIS
jgi:uncharacterized YigZ family protein